MPKRKNILFTDQMETDAGKVRKHYGLTTLSAAIRWALHAEALRLDASERVYPQRQRTPRGTRDGEREE